MKLTVVYTHGILVPETMTDGENCSKLQEGESYEVDLKKVRCPGHHRKYFAMIRKAMQCLPKGVGEFFEDEYKFRKYLEITAGYSEPFFHPVHGFIEVPKSIAYDKLDQTEFSELYRKVRAVVDVIVTKYITPEEFEKEFMTF